MNNKQLIKKLENACVVCRDCGLKYGVYSVGCSSVWEGKCGVCDQVKPVTETRDYGYLITGIRKLIKEDAERPEPKVRPFSELTKDFSPERKAKIKEQSKESRGYLSTRSKTRCILASNCSIVSPLGITLAMRLSRISKIRSVSNKSLRKAKESDLVSKSTRSPSRE